MTNHEIWQAVLAEFELALSKANFTTWFRNTGISEITDGHVTVCVPNTFTKSWLEKKYNSELVKNIERITSKPIKRIEYTVKNIKTLEEKECSFQKSPEPTKMFTQYPPRQTSGQQQITTDIGTKFGLNSKYTFQHFIVGKNNELAHAASQAVASRPGEAYNPLFVYGGVGLGKTHLLQAIAHEMLKGNPNLKVLYVSSEKFTNEFVSAVKEGRTKEFKERYRNADLLLIDDIQFIAGKEQTQEEFFHTFNELHQRGKQVVLTSDRPPKAIPALEDRLRSRFEWGMIADVSSADLETRTAILQSKCQEKNFSIGEDIIDLIATTVQSNIRELEGALNKVIAYHQLKNIEPSKESVRATLSSFEERGLKKILTPKELIALVAKFYGIDLDDILGKSREKRLSFPRQIAMHLLREEIKLSYPAIGQELGGRDHTTAMHAHTKIKKLLHTDAKLREEVELIKQQAKSPQ
ncbi:MAG: chromosomal replication initiator protein DnaA [Candidatus Magasanikbacteria bacterium]|nr:chromosomal replication initiator protein DnaA [Candidatus Magasanikbacteria bacterium]